MRIIKVLFIICFFFFCLLFLVQNYDVLRPGFTLRFSLPGIYEWAPTTEIPYYYVIIVSFTLGMIFATSFFIFNRMGAIVSNIKMYGKMRALESENERLRQEKEKAALAAAASTNDIDIHHAAAPSDTAAKTA